MVAACWAFIDPVCSQASLFQLYADTIAPGWRTELQHGADGTLTTEVYRPADTSRAQPDTLFRRPILMPARFIYTVNSRRALQSELAKIHYGTSPRR